MAMTEILLDGSHDARQLRTALGRFPTGVTIITTCTGQGKLEGLTANSFAALSLEPPLVLWSLSRKSASLDSFVQAGHFAINVLGAAQASLSHQFATPRAHKFERAAFTPGLNGAPLLDGALASFECSTEHSLDGGDHLLFVGRVRRIRYGHGDPLIFNAGSYCTTLPLRGASAESDLNGIWAGLG